MPSSTNICIICSFVDRFLTGCLPLMVNRFYSITNECFSADIIVAKDAIYATFIEVYLLPFWDLFLAVCAVIGHGFTRSTFVALTHLYALVAVFMSVSVRFL